MARPEDGRAYGARTIVVLPDLSRSANPRSPEARLEEAVSLASAIALEVVAAQVVRVRAPRPATLFGQGQVEMLAAKAAEVDAELIVVDGALSPLQQRNLERETKIKVIDRTGLILEIFGERAATHEGRLQVELAHLEYQASRLVRSWTHLERQRGGYGFLGGPGETQIETDRRLIRERMARIRKELNEVTRTRTLHRDRRQKAPYPVVALVGYTNAGKSTLFNRLSGADVVAKDLLFATLDPTMRSVDIPGFDKVIMSDTVGFISDLPTQLVAAFRATLEEVTEADLILHVRDISHPDTDAQANDVYRTLTDIGLDPHAEIPILEVWNKIDRLNPDEKKDIGGKDITPVSALSGEGFEPLRERIADQLRGDREIYRFLIPAGDGARLAWLEAQGEVVSRSVEGSFIEMDVWLSQIDHGRFMRMTEEIEAAAATKRS